MKILIAPDKFKGSLSATAVAEAIAIGVLRAQPGASVDRCPVADGGEGTVAAIVAATGGRIVIRRVTGPLPEMKVDASFGLLPDGVAVVEMAAASGLSLLEPKDRDPKATTTFGTGELIVAARDAGATKLILGIGGSATIDAGIGCAQACGLPVLLDGGEPVVDTEPLCGRDLDRVVLIKHGRGGAVDRLPIEVACDVTSPLFGPTGAAVVYGPQKGATPDNVGWFDEQLRTLATRTGKLDVANRPGAGAAGGLGFTMMAFFGALLRPGIELVLETCRFTERLTGADLCITGEGRLDAQTAAGKAVHGVARACKAAGVPCVAIVGYAGNGAERLRDEGLTDYVTLVSESVSPERAIHETAALLADRAEALVKRFLERTSGASSTRGMLLPLLLVTLLSLAGCAARPAPPVESHVYLIRGFRDWYSTGIDKLGDELRAAHCDAVVFAQADSAGAGESLVARAPRPLVLIGFSYGADDVVRIARRLNDNRTPVDLLVTIDPVTPPRVPRNVRACVNYYQSNGLADALPWLRGVPLLSEPGGTAIQNFNLRKDRADLLQPDTSHATIAGHTKLHAEIVRRVVGVVSPADTLSGSTLP